jgi:hypothetical protein
MQAGYLFLIIYSGKFCFFIKLLQIFLRPCFVNDVMTLKYMAIRSAALMYDHDAISAQHSEGKGKFYFPPASCGQMSVTTIPPRLSIASHKRVWTATAPYISISLHE